MVAAGQQFRHQAYVPGIALDEPVPRVLVVRLPDLPVLGEVIEADHRVAALQQFLYHVSADEARGPADQNPLHQAS
jgi:phage tail protein X